MLQPGAIVAGYRISALIGQGGMGTVYEATQIALDRTVALKLVSPRISADPIFVERFRREGRLQATLDHPHIITVYEAGESEEGLYLAMRLVRGSNLKDLILGRELDAGRSLRVLLQVGDALDAAHESGLIHRDIKPQNILVSAAGRDHAFLADFGVSKTPGVQSLTSTGYMVGTLDYVSPEQIKGHQASKASDIYAFAAVLYECLTGIVPFPRDTDAAVLYAHMTEPPPDVTERRPELPARLGKALQRGMAKDPADRPASARELLDEVQLALGPTLAAISPPGPIRAPSEAGIRLPSDPKTPRQTPTVEERLPADSKTPRQTRAFKGEPVRSGRGRGIALAIGLFVLVAVAGSFLLGSRASGSVSADEVVLSTGGARLEAPDNWAPFVSAPALGLGLSSPLAAGPVAGEGIALGRTLAPAPTYLPARFQARLRKEAVLERQIVLLGPHEAFRYANLRPSGDPRLLTVYVVLLEDRVISLACFAPVGAAPRFLPECESVASQVGLSHSLPLRSAAYAKSFNSIDRSFQASRRSALDRLRSASTPAAQADA
ncbi:MAG: serine/threonine protein kinase, partial [Actinobacteria bacterium]|nr:serine/threonine protein kinase [Actinomycetota bacterium]